MNRILTYLAAGLLTLTYLLSYIGFGIHTCSCSGSRQVILLFNNLSCEKIHAHIHIRGAHDHHPGDGCRECEESGHECAQNHQDGCCHTDIMVLTEDQDDSRQTEFINVEYRTLEYIGYLTDAAVLTSDGILHPVLMSGGTGYPLPPDTPARSADLLDLISVLRI